MRMQSLRSRLDELRGCLGDVCVKRPSNVRGQGRLAEGPLHQGHPAVAGRPVDRRGQVPTPQPRVAAGFDVGRRSAEAADQEVAQASLGSGQVVLGVHSGEDIVVRHAAVEGRHEALEAVFPDHVVADVARTPAGSSVVGGIAALHRHRAAPAQIPVHASGDVEA